MLSVCSVTLDGSAGTGSVADAGPGEDAAAVAEAPDAPDAADAASACVAWGLAGMSGEAVSSSAARTLGLARQSAAHRQARAALTASVAPVRVRSSESALRAASRCGRRTQRRCMKAPGKISPKDVAIVGPHRREAMQHGSWHRSY